MRKIRNDKSTYSSRSVLVQSPANTTKRSEKVASRGDFKVDAAGYFTWPKLQKGSGK